MINLTEQWKKGKLPRGYYYMQTKDGDIRIITRNIIVKHDGYSILAPVPSYDEWFKIKNLASLSECLQEKNIECLHRENKLKELLKECKQMLMSSNYENMAQYHEVLKLRDKINEVLK